MDAVVQMRQEPFACGLVVTGDVEAAAPLRVDGSGLYCGGSVRGREWISFGSAGGQPAADGVHGDLWSQAGVHALGGIWIRGAEEHGGGATPAPEDTDTHSAVNDVMSAVSAPSPEWMDTTDRWADDPGGALDRGCPEAGPDTIRSLTPSTVAPAGSGFIFWLSSGDAPVRVAGVRPPGWCPVLVVSDGDLALGDPSMDTSFDGAVVTRGHARRRRDDRDRRRTVRGHPPRGRSACRHCRALVEGAADPRPGLARHRRTGMHPFRQGTRFLVRNVCTGAWEL